MANWFTNFFRRDKTPTALPAPIEHARVLSPSVDIAPEDPLIAYFQNAPSVVEIDKLALDSPGARAMKATGVKLVVPLVSQGELVGLLNLGPRLSEQEYSTDDFGLLNNLATQAAPALRVAQLVRQQQTEALARERLEQELRVARLIQQTLLPKQIPDIAGYQIAALYQPARAVGGDFYDFLELENGLLGLVVGDVTDKGVPAALVMATTRAILRGSAQRLISPGQVLERVNELLCPDIPENMFVTCLYAILDPRTGKMKYANAGHDLPYRRMDGGVSELRATGMPLGLLPGMTYEEKETTVAVGETILFYSDGIVEAHNVEKEMFGFPRLMGLVGNHRGGATLIAFLQNELQKFTGADWEQEDDVTMMTLTRSGLPNGVADKKPARADSKTLAEFSLPSQPGNERDAMHRVAEAVKELGLPAARLEKLKTAVAEATMNALEHGNKYRAELLVNIVVTASAENVVVKITDHGGGADIPTPETPDLDAKLAGMQSPRGWGLFLIKNLVDEMNVTHDNQHHTVELILRRKEE